MRSGILLRHAEGDVPSPGMTEQMNRPRLQSPNEARNVGRVLLHGEIVAFAVPFFRPAMPQADRDRAVMRAERPICGAQWR